LPPSSSLFPYTTLFRSPAIPVSGSSARRVGVELPRGGGRCRYRFEPSPHAGVGRGDTTVEVTADGASSRRGGSMLSRARARNCSTVQSDLATPTTGP